MSRTPTVVPDEISLTKMRVTLLVDGLVKKDKQRIKQGTIDVQLRKTGLTFNATINTKQGEEQWEYTCRKFPSIVREPPHSTWHVENGKVVIDLMKEESISWQSMVRRGLDQAGGSSSDEDF